MKKLILSIALLLTASASHSTCVPKVVFLSGQSNAVWLAKAGNLPKVFGSYGCPAIVTGSIQSGKGIDVFMPSVNPLSPFARAGESVKAMSTRYKRDIKADVIIHSQGESNAGTQSGLFAQKTSYVLGMLRATFGKTENTPIIVVQLNDRPHADRPDWLTIREEQATLQSIPNLKIIDSSAYLFKPDDVHMLNNADGELNQYPLLAEDIKATLDTMPN